MMAHGRDCYPFTFNMNVASSSIDAVNLLASLATGLVIGIERGWSQRERGEGGRVAGLRTFSLVGLLGGLLVLMANAFNAWILPAAILGFSLLLAVSFREAARATGDLSITTAVALLLTLLLGAAAMHGHVAVALASSVVAAILLDLKSTLHRWLRLIRQQELVAALQMLVLSVVILPNLPDAGYGPYGALNPYQLWWAVVLIAGLSLAGHFLMRITGFERGLFFTGVLGGLASSTAATLSLARLAAKQPALSRVAGAGALAACGVMFFRMLVLLATIAPGLLKSFGLALGTTGVVLLLIGLWHWRNALKQPPLVEDGAPIEAFDLSTALVFGAFLAVMAVTVPAAKEWLGASGVFVVSALSGVLDVDAIVISIARIFRTGAIAFDVALIALCIAVLANMLTKIGIALFAGGNALGQLVMRGYAMALMAGALPVFATLL
ncbi:MgtC/SapB family protein [Pseudoduganella sp. OTU4001]|uniref:MgtC/SapB family protein n=1 Tax=Pseudoduganella sp. OTU4001 TaxID=3043854 RepID=UPI00313CDC3D